MFPLAALFLAAAADDPTAYAKPFPAPEFVGVTAWANGDAVKLADQKDKVVILHFWTFGCFNCVNNYPHYRAWQKEFKDKKVTFVGVHTPEFDAEKSMDRIKEQAKKHELTFRIAVDNDQKTWAAWSNRYWPCVYLIDKKGMVRHRWQGELGTDGEKRMRANVEKLLAE
jgi:peroxiredoxin